MFYAKNLPRWERVVRLGAGLVMLGCSAQWLRSNPLLAALFAASGVLTLATGFFGFCPMCALAGRRLKS